MLCLLECKHTISLCFWASRAQMAMSCHRSVLAMEVGQRISLHIFVVCALCPLAPGSLLSLFHFVCEYLVFCSRICSPLFLFVCHTPTVMLPHQSFLTKKLSRLREAKSESYDGSFLQHSLYLLSFFLCQKLLILNFSLQIHYELGGLVCLRTGLLILSMNSISLI